MLLPAILPVLAGCTPVQQTLPPAGMAVQSQPQSQAQPQASVNSFIDPCGDRIQDLCGPLIEYFTLYHHGPARVEELQQFADPGQTLKFACTDTGKPFQCAPTGLAAPGQSMRIFVYAADPSPDGGRWCVYSKPGVTSGVSEAFFAEKIPEAKFRQFQVFADPLQFK